MAPTRGKKGNNSLKGKEVLGEGCEQQHDAACSSQCFICIPWTPLQVLKWPRNTSTTNIYNHVILIQFECIPDGFQLPTKLHLCPRLQVTPPHVATHLHNIQQEEKPQSIVCHLVGNGPATEQTFVQRAALASPAAETPGNDPPLEMTHTCG